MISKILDVTNVVFKKTSILLIIFLVFLGSIFELLSLGLVIPLISIFSENIDNFFLIDYVKKGIIKKDENVIFMFTGGSPAIFAYNEEVSI